MGNSAATTVLTISANLLQQPSTRHAAVPCREKKATNSNSDPPKAKKWVEKELHDTGSVSHDTVTNFVESKSILREIFCKSTLVALRRLISVMPVAYFASCSQTKPHLNPPHMDLAKDFLNVAQTVANVPGLTTAVSLAVQIITTIQKYKQNNSRLRQLANSIADNLIGIAECMKGRWDDAPVKLGDYVHEFEEALRQVLELVTKYSKTSLLARATALMNAGDREMEISRAETAVANAQRSILLLMTLDNSVTVKQIYQQGRATHGTLLEFFDNSQNLQMATGSSTAGESVPRLYTRGDVVLLGKILPHRVVYRNGKCLLKVALHEAERRSDGSRVLVKTYEGQKHHKEEVFLTNLKHHTDNWDSSVLQLIGASSSTEAVPFDVYHLPSLQLESFGDWIGHSARSNPVETILGLYDMRNSVKDLLDFQRHNSVKFTRKIFRSSLVAVRRHGDRQQWSLIYAGELVTKSSVKVESPYKAFRSLRWDPLVLNSDKGPRRNLIASFTGGINHWGEGSRDLDTIIDTSMNFNKLASALFQNGLLGDCGGVVLPRDEIALGDVGYVDRDGLFVVVGNLHNQLLSLGGRSPKWEKTKLNYGSGIVLKNEAVIVGPSGKTYHRSNCIVVEPKPSVEVGVAYKDLDEEHAWRLFQRSACEIIARNGLSVEPHELKLIQSIEYFLYMTLQRVESSPSDNLAGGAVLAMEDQTSGQAPAPVQSIPDVQDIPSVAYIFENGDAVQVRESGAPALAGRLRPTLDEEPSWLDDEEAWRMNSGEEKINGLEMGYMSDYMAFYTQLPPGIAIPYAVQEE